MKRLTQTLIFAAVLLLLLTSLASAQAEKTILDTLAEDGRFTTLLAAIEITETGQAFSEGHWTLFAPTDAAFAAVGLDAENLAAQLTLQETADLLLYQALTKEVTIDGARKMLGDVTMANGWLAGLKWYDDSLWINDEARVIEPDIFATNGFIHVVNQVITPPWPRSEEETDITLMLSIEEAKLLKLEEMETAAASSGAETLLPEMSDEDMAAEETEEAVAIPETSLIGVMVEDGRFTTYLAAVGALDLVVPYIEGEWTLFAPTDDAFAKEGLDAANIATELAVGELADLLLYHALDEEVTLDKAKTMLGDITMRNGQIAGLKFFEETLWVNDNARVVTADMRADNGIIHALDEIIARPWPRVEPEPEAVEEQPLHGEIP